MTKAAQNGFSLIELVVFIVLLAIGISLLIPLSVTTRYTQLIDKNSQATALAEQRMELILAQREIYGFNSFSDPCVGASPPAACNMLTGFTATTTIANNWNGDSNYKVITVNVTGDATANLQSLVANY